MSSTTVYETPGPDEPAEWWRRRLLPAGLLVAITLVAYIPVYNAGFIWDDDDYVIHNMLLRRGLQGLQWMWTKPGATPQYYPLTHTTFWIEWQLWQADPRGYHVVNVLLHAASSVLLWRVLSRLGLRAAWLAAAVFAVHPVHVESVAWITERKNTLSGMLYLAAMLCYVTGALRRDAAHMLRPPRWGWYLAALVLFAGAVLSKTVAGSLPAALLLILWWRSGQLPWRHVLPLLPMLIFAAVMGRFTAHMEATVVGAVGPDWDFTFIERCLIAGRAAWFYAYKLLLPVNLIFIYPRWNIDQSGAWQYLFPLMAALVVVGLFFLRHRLGRGPRERLSDALLVRRRSFPVPREHWGDRAWL
jgi:protein O-mannosyl-transferase